MSHMHNEDLFEHTKMSFGEHLEELRTCLVRALLGLAVGFLVGLLVAGDVVRQIEGPLERALEKFHFEKTKSELEAQYGSVPPTLQEFMRREGFIYEELYWEVDELRRVVSQIEKPARRQNDQTRRSDGAETALASRTNNPPDLDRPTQGSSAEPTPSANDDAGNDENSGLNADEATDIVVISRPGPLSSRMVKTRLWRPLATGVTSLSAHEPFMIYIKAAVITGAILASPWIFWQIWAFVASGLYPHERNYVYFFLPVSLGLFFAGAALAFFFVFDPVLDFLFTFNRMMNIDPDPRISEWMSFVLFLPLGFGISFQLTLVMMIVERIGVVTVGSYLEKWRLAVLGIFVLSMFLTPADPISMLLMAVPLTLLYFGGILLCLYMPRQSSPYGEGYDPA